MEYYLLAEKGHGPMSEESAKQYSDEKAIFECRVCSTANQRVFHNTLGRHIHAHLYPSGTFKGLVEHPRG